MSEIKPVIYNTSKEVVKVMKKDWKPFKQIIKNEMTFEKMFPFVSIKKLPKFDVCVQKFYSNNYKYNQSIDDRIKKMVQKYSIHKKPNKESQQEVEESEDTDEPLNKKRKVMVTDLDINIITNENEDLDFEEDNDKTNEFKSENDSKSQQKSLNTNYSLKLNGSQKIDYSKTNGFNNNSFKSESSTFNGIFPSNSMTSGLSFKIPKKITQTIESILSHSQTLSKSKRPIDAYNYLEKYLSEDQWKLEEVRTLLLTVANNLVTTNEFFANLSKFNDLIDKIKSLKYFDDCFWDEIIYAVEKKKNDSKNIHQINIFLSNLYDFMNENKINVRIVCGDAVIIAYRITTNHPTAKDLQDIPL